MNKKRYSIVRVDKYGNYLNSCPAGFENINNDFVCAYRKDKVLNQYVHNCKKCRYGDTKEQLVLKITQVLRTKRALFGITDKQLAESIIEFLGVE